MASPNKVPNISSDGTISIDFVFKLLKIIDQQSKENALLLQENAKLNDYNDNNNSEETITTNDSWSSSGASYPSLDTNNNNLACSGFDDYNKKPAAVNTPNKKSNGNDNDNNDNVNNYNNITINNNNNNIYSNNINNNIINNYINTLSSSTKKLRDQLLMSDSESVDTTIHDNENTTNNFILNINNNENNSTYNNNNNENTFEIINNNENTLEIINNNEIIMDNNNINVNNIIQNNNINPRYNLRLTPQRLTPQRNTPQRNNLQRNTPLRIQQKRSTTKKRGRKTNKINPVPKVNRMHKRHNFTYSIRQKINMMNEAQSMGLSVRATAKLWGCCPGSISHHKKNLNKYMEKVLINPNAKTANKGRTPFDIDLERSFNEWYEELEMEDIPVKTSNIIAYALSLQPNFKNGQWGLLQHWVYRFMRRYDLTLRQVTHKGQKLSGHLLRIKQQTTTAINKRFSEDGTMFGTDPKYFLNMDQTAVFFESKSQTVVSCKGKKSVPSRDSGCNAKRATIVITVGNFPLSSN